MAKKKGGNTVAEVSALVEPITPLSKYPAVWPGDEDYFNNDIALYYGLAEYSVTEYVNH